MTDSSSRDDQFRDELVAVIPQMRAFARSLCGDPTAADDLVQDALGRAWDKRDSFELGTNIKAWAFMITRNQFYSDKRRSWRQQPLDTEVAERTLVAVSDPTAALELDEVRRALSMLPDAQREALILVGAGGMSYEEVAEICGAAVGTIKSRVSRARDRLDEIMRLGVVEEDAVLPSDAFAAILAQIDQIRSARAAA
jgi:RNA polymerase sigma-70 factor (ECF subfamily)